jgi:hypothetical protein
MELRENVPAFIQYRDALLAGDFRYYRPDPEFILTREAQSLITAVTDCFYLKRYFRSSGFPFFKKFFFDFDYRSHRIRYPRLLTKEILDPASFSDAVPGNTIEQNLFIAQFMELRDPVGRFFTDRFGRPLEPFALSAQPVLQTLKELAARLTGTDARSAQKAEVVASYAADLEKLLTVFELVGKLFMQMKSASLPQLRSGHLLGMVSGLNSFFSELSRTFTAFGLVLVSLPGLPPAIPLIDRLALLSRDAATSYTADMLEPALVSMNCRLEMRDNRLRIIDEDPVHVGPFTRFLDSILDLFLPPVKDDNNGGDGIDVVEKERAAAEKAIADAKRMKSADEAAPQGQKTAQKPPEEDLGPILPGTQFQSMLDNLKRFNEMLKNDLAPEIGEKGEMKNFKQGFDQFDVAPAERNFQDGRIILNGRFNNIPGDVRYSDKMIVESTHWLYDRVKTILEYYRVGELGIPLERARLLVEDVRGLFYPSKNEYNDARRYGSFQQFRISVRRIFSTNSIQNRYNNLVAQISNQLDDTRYLVIQEQTKLEDQQTAKKK